MELRITHWKSVHKTADELKQCPGKKWGNAPGAIGSCSAPPSRECGNSSRSELQGKPFPNVSTASSLQRPDGEQSTLQSHASYYPDGVKSLDNNYQHAGEVMDRDSPEPCDKQKSLQCILSACEG